MSIRSHDLIFVVNYAAFDQSATSFEYLEVFLELHFMNQKRTYIRELHNFILRNMATPSFNS